MNTALLQHVQVCVCSTGHVNVSQWYWELFFLQHIQLKSMFNAMTTYVIPFDPPKIVAGFTVQLSSKITTELFASCGLIPYKSEFAENLISSRQFCCSIFDWEFEIVTAFRRYYFFCFGLRGIDF